MDLSSDRIKIGNGIYLNMIRSDKFKSNLLSYYFIRPLSVKEVTYNSLIPLVLKQGSKNYPNSLELDKKLEELYGAGISLGVGKKGEKQILRYSIQWVSEDYTNEEGLDKEAINMLRELIYNPILEDGVFKEKYVEQEKRNLENIIKAKINNKRSFAINRCIESMCRNERYGIYHHGRVEDLENINSENLYEHYENILSTSNIEIFYVGNYDDEIVEYLREINKLEREKLIDIPDDVIVGAVQTKNMVRDNLDVVQGKMVVGYRSRIRHSQTDEFNALLLANEILGGGPNSKLFKDIREKESLAYYIVSSIHKYKSIMLVDAGIDSNNFDRALDIIREDLHEVKMGEFTDEEMEISKKSIKSAYESVKDSAFGISEFFFNQIMSDDYRSIDKRKEDLDKVTREEIMEAAETIVVDTIYFMNNKTE